MSNLTIHLQNILPETFPLWLVFDEYELEEPGWASLNLMSEAETLELFATLSSSSLSLPTGLLGTASQSESRDLQKNKLNQGQQNLGSVRNFQEQCYQI